ncbi:YceD family protein [Thalassobacillus hwangdonensis]|uniref:YceD family protein n=1 Tax=Thalassobacillus hwangdonensis TaxID=546108 RepID=A0ABW3KWL4_9BACI
MKFPLQKLKQTGQEPFEFDDHVDISELEEMNNDIRHIPPVHVKGYATTQGEEVTFVFTVDGVMTLPCARTLVDVEYRFHVDAVEVFSTSRYYEEEDESEVHPVDGEMLDLTPYIKENVLLEVPMRVFSENDEAYEKAPQEGKGWQLVTEEPEEKKIDPRMAKLQSLLDDEKQN